MPHATTTTTTPPPADASARRRSHPRPHQPHLPLELWMHIVALAAAGADTDALPALWFAARATSRALRAAAEAAFPSAVLRPWLHVCAFGAPRVALAFDRLVAATGAGAGAGAGAGRAVLRAVPWVGLEERPRSGLGSGLGARVDGVESEWVRLLGEGAERGFGDYMVCLKGVVQDTELVGWRVVGGGEGGDGGVFEVEVEWKGMLDRMFGEELRARRRGDVLAERFKRDREAKWAVYGPGIVKDQLNFKTFEAILLGNENHRAYQNGYRDSRRLRIERWIERAEKEAGDAHALRKREIAVEWLPNFRMNAVRERLEKKMVEWGEERYPQPSVLKKRLLESDVPMKRALGIVDPELAEKDAGWSYIDQADPKRYAEVGLLWKGKTAEEVDDILRARAAATEPDSAPSSKRQLLQVG